MCANLDEVAGSDHRTATFPCLAVEVDTVSTDLHLVYDLQTFSDVIQTRRLEIHRLKPVLSHSMGLPLL